MSIQALQYVSIQAPTTTTASADSLDLRIDSQRFSRDDRNRNLSNPNHNCTNVDLSTHRTSNNHKKITIKRGMGNAWPDNVV